MDAIEVGDRVLANDEPVGTVAARIGAGPPGTEPSLVVRRDDGALIEVPESLVVEADAGAVHLAIHPSALVEGQTAPAATGGGEIHRLALHEEVLEPIVVPAARGVVRLTRRVETVPVEETVETWRDDVSVERVAIGREVEAIPEPRQEGDTLVVPIVEETIVVERRLVLREEVRVTRRRVSEPVRVTGEVRRQRLDIQHVAPESAEACPE